MAKLSKADLEQHGRDIVGRAKHYGFYRRCQQVLDELEAARKPKPRKKAEVSDGEA